MFIIYYYNIITFLNHVGWLNNCVAQKHWKIDMRLIIILLIIKIRFSKGKVYKNNNNNDGDNDETTSERAGLATVRDT